MKLDITLSDEQMAAIGDARAQFNAENPDRAIDDDGAFLATVLAEITNGWLSRLRGRLAQQLAELKPADVIAVRQQITDAHAVVVAERAAQAKAEAEAKAAANAAELQRRADNEAAMAAATAARMQSDAERIAALEAQVADLSKKG